MRHRKSGRKFGMDSSARKAMFRNMVTSLMLHGRITTTVARAKEFRPYAEKLITLGKKAAAAREAGDQVEALNAYRRLLQELHDEGVVAKICDEIGPHFADRPGGYTRILRHATGRLGDNAPTALFELIDFESLGVEDAAEVDEASA